MHIFDFDILDEDPQKYEELLNGLWDQYQPIGKAEELEVERIALCWWRLKRVWRYENVVNRIGRRDLTRRELDYQKEWLDEQDREGEEMILLLQSAKKEIEEKGEISPELKQKISTTSPGFESVLRSIERFTEIRVKEPAISRALRKLSASERSSVLAAHNVTRGICLLERLQQMRYHSITEVAVGQNAIPNREVLDKILRYETTIERNLSRSLDRLERLQRRREGEVVPPPVSVHLTR